MNHSACHDGSVGTAHTESIDTSFEDTDSKSCKRKDCQGGEPAKKRHRSKKPIDAPRRPKSAYMFFLAEFRAKYKIANPDTTKVAEVAKAAGEVWRSLTPEQRAAYEQKSVGAKAQYAEAKRVYDNDHPRPQRSVTKEKDPAEIKRPQSAYFLFLSDFRAQFKGMHPDQHLQVSEMGRLAGEKWKTMTEEEKLPYVRLSAASKEEYARMKTLTPEERIMFEVGQNATASGFSLQPRAAVPCASNENGKVGPQAKGSSGSSATAGPQMFPEQRPICISPPKLCSNSCSTSLHENSSAYTGTLPTSQPGPRPDLQLLQSLYHPLAHLHTANSMLSAVDVADKTAQVLKERSFGNKPNMLQPLSQTLQDTMKHFQALQSTQDAANLNCQPAAMTGMPPGSQCPATRELVPAASCSSNDSRLPPNQDAVMTLLQQQHWPLSPTAANQLLQLLTMTQNQPPLQQQNLSNGQAVMPSCSVQMTPSNGGRSSQQQSLPIQDPSKPIKSSTPPLPSAPGVKSAGIQSNSDAQSIINLRALAAASNLSPLQLRLLSLQAENLLEAARVDAVLKSWAQCGDANPYATLAGLQQLLPQNAGQPGSAAEKALLSQLGLSGGNLLSRLGSGGLSDVMMGPGTYSKLPNASTPPSIAALAWHALNAPHNM